MLARARALLRHASRPARQEELGWPGEGELDLDRTLDAGFAGLPRAGQAAPDPSALRLVHTAPRTAEVVAILDMSLSMTGEKIALVAVAVAILKMKLELLPVVAFDTVAHPLVRAGEIVSAREIVRRVLEVPAQGYTNIDAGLRSGLAELRRSRERERAGLLFTDGVANVGGDPVRAAAAFPRLHVIHLGDHNPQGARCCREMSSAGRGRIYRAHTWGDLPGIVRRAVRELFRS